ncbi:DNA/RNA-binding domain of Phe-tRNA-synthetase-like protein [Arthrobacter sp. PL16]|uniref:B3/B4 domain-containing protein n=1 Tax=Arthrobacter sp. PL16 TaxID=3071720 RepID=UPI002E0B488A|nr:DNA/RNA-binding domain of Phe-tRNA-synthetase-like protein [Arthrobacter sp. PL16]
MTEARQHQDFLEAARVDEAVFALRPDYRALLIAVDGLVAGPSDAESETLLQRAEAAAGAWLAERPVTELPHVVSWREAYQGFGAKPNRTRNSLEALLRRTPVGLPRVNRLTDIYNAISVLHQIPLGGEDHARYQGSPTLIRATGNEIFDTASNGEIVIEHPEPGEVVWMDDAGVTCRRWNWRQGRRTQLTDNTTSALFILDALAPLTEDDLTAAADDLSGHLERLGPNVTITRRLITPDTASAPGTANASGLLGEEGRS